MEYDHTGDSPQIDPPTDEPAHDGTTPDIVTGLPAGPTQQERLDALRASLDAGVEAMMAEFAAGPSDHLQRYLDFAARFHRYSPTNQFLIAMQRPEATHVASYRAWEAMGYHVTPGEKGIKVFAPMLTRTVEQDAQTGEEIVVQRTTGFRVGHVFDVAQLRADERAQRPLPEFFVPLGDDPTGLAQRLERVIGADGIAIEESDQRGAEGSSRGGVIGVRPGLDPVSRAQTLAHEYAHEKLHQNPAYPEHQALPARIKEAQAEAVTYIVCHHFGLPAPLSVDYIRMTGATPKEVLAELRAISITASRMIQAIERLDALAEEENRNADRGAHDSRAGVTPAPGVGVVDEIRGETEPPEEPDPSAPDDPDDSVKHVGPREPLEP